jgi:3-oxoacyl-[acyl-carrier-protein] synthase III
MTDTSLQPIQVLATGRALPDQGMENPDIEELVRLPEGWIGTRIRIERRYWSVDLNTGMPRKGCKNSELAAMAAKRALQKSGLAPEEIDPALHAQAVSKLCSPPRARSLPAPRKWL